jgi:hypothetical protein
MSATMSQFQQSDVNPSVALDKESMNFRLLLFADGTYTF